MAYYEENPNTGQPYNAQQPNNAQQFSQQTQYQNQPQYNQSFNNYVDTGHSPMQIMVFGIVSLCAAILVGWTVLLGILAIVFGALAISWANKFKMGNPGIDDGQVKAGRITGIIGLVFGIINIVAGIFVWIFMLGLFAIAGGY